MGQPGLVIKAHDTNTELVVRMRRQTPRYFDEFLNLKCAPQLLEHGLFPNGKEVTEAFAVWSAIRKYVPGLQESGYRGMAFLDIGSGVQPRFAALAAMLSAGTAIAIDPRLRTESHISIKRVHRFSETAEEYASRPLEDRPDNGLIPVACLVHGHAPVHEVLACLDGRDGWIVALPCCVPFNHQATDFGYRLKVISEYTDWGVWSPKRRVIVCRAIFTDRDGALAPGEAGSEGALAPFHRGATVLFDPADGTAASDHPIGALATEADSKATKQFGGRYVLGAGLTEAAARAIATAAGAQFVVMPPE